MGGLVEVAEASAAAVSREDGDNEPAPHHAPSVDDRLERPARFPEDSPQDNRTHNPGVRPERADPLRYRALPCNAYSVGLSFAPWGISPSSR